jgi:hypothetical protein
LDQLVARADWSRRRNPPLDGNEEAGYGFAYNPPYALRYAGPKANPDIASLIQATLAESSRDPINVEIVDYH